MGKDEGGEGKPEAATELFTWGSIEVLVLAALEGPDNKAGEHKSQAGG